MNRIEQSTAEIQKKCGSLAESLKEQEWRSLNRSGFENASQEAINDLKGIQKEFNQLEKFLEYETIETEKDVKQKNKELASLIKSLEKNREFEEKKSASKLADFDFLPEKQKYNEQFSLLQHQTATLLLQTGYIMEKLLLETRKDHFTPFNEKTTSKSLLDLLKTREEEIQELKKKNSTIQRNALVGAQAIEGTADIEQEIQQNSQKISVHQHRLEESLKHHSQSTQAMFESAGQLQNETSALQQLLWNHFQKSQELITNLKKERDFARQLALDTENETLGLRSQYSRELLGLQEKIASVRSQNKHEFEARLQKLENELEHKNQMLSHFRETVAGQSKKIDELEEKNKQLRMLFQTHTKHEAAKRAFGKKNEKRP